jgi:hypothetical protein
MEFLLSPDSQVLWTVVLALALFVPVRQLIWVVSVRRAERREGPADDDRKRSLKRRASVTSALLCFVFAYFYSTQMLQAAP